MRIISGTMRVFILTGFLFLISGCSNPKFEQFVLNGNTMGTTFSIKIVEPAGSNKISPNMEPDLYRLLQSINLQMSTYIDSSEISQFNQYKGNDWFSVSEDLAIVVQAALRISKESDGAFDITIGPLVNLWGFGPEYHKNELPGEELIAQRKKLIGFKNLSVSLNPPALKKEIPDLYCDLSAIAKGFGVDKVADFIKSQGHENYLVEIGGEIRSAGHNSTGAKWRVGISSPKTQPGIQKVLDVANSGMATSGDYMNYFEKDGVRYSHTIDPRTGRPITHQLASVTVVLDTCMIADAYATAITVLGQDEGYAFAERMNLLVFMIVKDKDGFMEKMTPGFEPLIEKIKL